MKTKISGHSKICRPDDFTEISQKGNNLFERGTSELLFPRNSGKGLRQILDRP